MDEENEKGGSGYLSLDLIKDSSRVIKKKWYGMIAESQSS